MVNVYKEKDYSEYVSEETDEPFPTQNPQFPGLAGMLFSSAQGLQSDFGNVFEAAKKFPIRSTLTVIGFLTVVYIGFKISRTFVKI